MSRPPLALIVQLRKIREERRLTQAELAEHMGYTRCSLSYWESGHRSPPFRAFMDWLDALGVKLELVRQ